MPVPFAGGEIEVEVNRSASAPVSLTVTNEVADPPEVIDAMLTVADARRLAAELVKACNATDGTIEVHAHQAEAPQRILVVRDPRAGWGR